MITPTPPQAVEIPDISQMPYLVEHEFWMWSEHWKSGSHMIGYVNLEKMVTDYCQGLPAGNYTIHMIDHKGNHRSCTVEAEVGTFYRMLTPFT